MHVLLDAYEHGGCEISNVARVFMEEAIRVYKLARDWPAGRDVMRRYKLARDWPVVVTSSAVTSNTEISQNYVTRFLSPKIF